MRRITVKKLFNIGNYENVSIEISDDVYLEGLDVNITEETIKAYKNLHADITKCFESNYKNKLKDDVLLTGNINNILEHKQEILNSRIGGFGGSDANLFLIIAKKGIKNLSETLKKRIRIAKGLESPDNLPDNEAQRKGREFEDNMNMYFLPEYGWKREAKIYIRNNHLTPFSIFIHADYFNKDKKELIECKYSGVLTSDEILKKYMPQFQFQHLVSECYMLKLRCSVNGSTELFQDINIVKDENIISELLKGINILAENWDNNELFIPKFLNKKCDGIDFNVGDMLT